MKKDGHLLLQIYQRLNTLSIDVCLGAIAGGIMATHLLATDPGWAYWFVLPMAVWLIYTADHLIDGYRMGDNKTHVRHLYHRKYRKQLVLLSFLVLIIAAVISFRYLPYNIILFGVVLGVLAIIYLTLVFVIPSGSVVFFQKELLVALFYTAGIWGPVIIMNQALSTTEIIIVLMFFLLAFEDLIMLSMIEIKADSKAGQGSLPMFLGYRHSRKLFYILVGTVLLLSFAIILSNPAGSLLKATIIMILMQTGLFFILRFSSFFRKRELYRYLSEAVFFLPALMFL